MKNKLIERETLLHKFEIRKNTEKVMELLHPSFLEVGRSGESYDLKSIIDMMKCEQPSLGHVHAQEFNCIEVEKNVQLLLYKSVWVAESGELSMFAKRSSLWVDNDNRWQIKYHQATPCSRFALLK